MQQGREAAARRPDVEVQPRVLPRVLPQADQGRSRCSRAGHRPRIPRRGGHRERRRPEAHRERAQVRGARGIRQGDVAPPASARPACDGRRNRGVRQVHHARRAEPRVGLRLRVLRRAHEDGDGVGGGQHRRPVHEQGRRAFAAGRRVLSRDNPRRLRLRGAPPRDGHRHPQRAVPVPGVRQLLARVHGRSVLALPAPDVDDAGGMAHADDAALLPLEPDKRTPTSRP